MDAFIIFAPILLLAVVAVLGFVGCSFHTNPAPSLTIGPAHGLSFGGTQVTITGSSTDFVTINQVTLSDSSGFSATASNVGAVSGQAFTANTPPYTGLITGNGAAVDLTVSYTDSNGKNQTVHANSAFTYYPPVTHVQTATVGAAGGKTLTSPTLNLQGGEVVLATVQWAGPAAPLPTLLGASFQPVVPSPYSWNSVNVLPLHAINSLNGPVTVSVTLSQNSTAPWSLCVSAYDFADNTKPIYNPVQGNPTYTGKNPQAPAINNANPGDLIYAVAYAADPGGLFPGTNSLSADPGFKAESGVISYGGTTAMDPLVEDAQVMTMSSVAASATNTSPNLNPRGWIFALALKVAKT